MQKILVTGATGYIGAHVVKVLLKKGYHVIASSLSYEGLDSRVERSSVPIFSGQKNIYQALGKPDVCIHLAWQDGFVHNSPAHMANLSKHVQFCYNMMESGLPMLSVMGTMHEVGYWEGKIDENTPCNPLTQYGIAKNALRQSLLLFAKTTSCALHWLRAFYITGDDFKSNSIFSKIVRAVKEGKKEFPFTMGKNKYDFIDVDTLAEMIVAASVQSRINGIINVCTGKPISLAERVEKFILENNYDIKLNYGIFPDRPYDSPGVWGDPQKIDAILNL